MKVDKFGQIIYSEVDLCDLYLKFTDRKIDNILVDTDINFASELDLNHIPTITKYIKPSSTLEEFDIEQQKIWFLPNEYDELDIASWVLEQCSNDEELQRAGAELILFQERGMFPLLRYLKYLVDTLRKYNIVWGVGRGSSVASFVLFLIGVHKINSLYYDLSIDEFLK